MERNVPLFILSIPFVVAAYIAFALFVAMSILAIVIGRKQAFDAIYWLKERI